MSGKAAIIGAGGHCRALLAALKASEKYDEFSIYDLEPVRAKETILGIRVTGSVDTFLDQQKRCRSNCDVFLAIGDNHLRQYWFDRLRWFELQLPNLVSNSAIVSEGARLADSAVQILPNAFIGPEAAIGANSIINTASVIEHEVQVGNHCHVCPQATLAGRVIVKDMSFIGAGCVVRDGCSVARNTIVGAGAIVVKDIVKTGQTVVGVPAVQLGQAED